MAQKRNNNGTSWQTILVVVLVGAMLVGLIGASFLSGGSIVQKEQTVRQIAMSCTTDMATQFHIHPHLEIVIDGKTQTVPADIGITADCMHPLHTHDTSGTIHVESPEKRDFTLGDFFAVWNQPFSRNQILGSVADDTHEVVMTVNGQPSTDYEDLILRDKDAIVITYQKKGAFGVGDIKVQGNGQIQVTTEPVK